METLTFKPVEGSHVDAAAAQRSGEIVYMLAAEHGSATAETFLAKAKQEPRNSPLLPHFKNWNAKESAEEFWLAQARYLMRSFDIVTVEEGEPVERRGAYFVPESNGYVPTPQIRDSESKTLSLVDSAREQAVSYYRRYSSILALTGRRGDRGVRRVLKAIEDEFGDQLE